MSSLVIFIQEKVASAEHHPDSYWLTKIINAFLHIRNPYHFTEFQKDTIEFILVIIKV
jgi:hypothetical protein